MANNLPITEEIDFAYLLELMRPLHDVPAFAWLPELFSIIGHERLITLCQYAGGETLTVPTVEQLTESIEALQWFYDVVIKRSREEADVPQSLKPLFYTIVRIFDARNSQSNDI